MDASVLGDVCRFALALSYAMCIYALPFAFSMSCARRLALSSLVAGTSV